MIRRNNMILIPVMIMIMSVVSVLSGCVDQHPDNTGTAADYTDVYDDTDNAGNTEGADSDTADVTGNVSDGISDDNISKAVYLAADKVKGLGRSPRIIATSAATADICDRLGIELVGVPQTEISSLPDRYRDAARIGSPMNPDMELLSSLSPDWILGPVSLKGDLQDKYDNLGVEWAFLNLNSVYGMYQSINELGIIFGKEKKAKNIIDEFNNFYDSYKAENSNKNKPSVMILMGMPGSYVIATENSYVGSLVEMAGGINVYAGTDKEFLSVNTEDMETRKPDIILRAAHALPDKVADMFADEFRNNDIWKHFDAVRNGRVYDLSFDNCGMSANFNYKDALKELQGIFYEQL